MGTELLKIKMYREKLGCLKKNNKSCCQDNTIHANKSLYLHWFSQEIGIELLKIKMYREKLGCLQ